MSATHTAIGSGAEKDLLSDPSVQEVETQPDEASCGN